MTAAHAGQISGQVATWVMLASLVPEQLRVVVAVSPFNFTNELIQASGQFTLNLLAADQTAWMVRFGLYSSREINKFEGIFYQLSPEGLPLLPDTCGWAECRIGQQLFTGDRYLYIADVLEHQVDPERQPLREQEAFSQLTADERTALDEKLQRDIDHSRSLIQPFLT